VYVGGVFTNAGGVSANCIARWNGSSWSALGSGVSGVVNNTWVNAIAVNGTNVYVGGRFTTAGSGAASNIAKWNGSSWSALGTGMNGYVDAIAVSGSNVYVGGSFTSAGGASANRVAKWNGSSWSALGSGVNDGVYALAVNGSDVYVGGAFATAGGKPSSHFGIWHDMPEPVPYLRAMRTSTNTVCVWWPVPDTTWQLEATTNLASPGSVWTPRSYFTNGANCEYIESAPSGGKFYRLRQP
jgi:hypothetical protein